MVKGFAAPDKELLPLWHFKLKFDIVVDVMLLWQFLEVDIFDVWESRKCYLIIRLFVENCLHVGAEEDHQSLQGR